MLSRGSQWVKTQQGEIALEGKRHQGQFQRLTANGIALEEGKEAKNHWTAIDLHKIRRSLRQT